MPFVYEKDNATYNAKLVGNGSPISQYEVKYYVSSDPNAFANIGGYDPEKNTKFQRIIGVEKFDANAPASQIKFYDGFDQRGVKRGRMEATLEITQEDYGLKETIKKLENTDCWWVEAIGDDRDLFNADGSYRFQYVNCYWGKLVEYSADKSELYKVTGKGSFDTAKEKNIFRKFTPCNSIDASSMSFTSTTAKDITFTGKDYYNDSVDLSSANNEVTGVTVVQKSGTPTLTIIAGVGDPTNRAMKNIKFSVIGTAVITVTVTTANGGTFTKDITLTSA